MKRLIVCCDGTWQNLSTDYPTNVVRIIQLLHTRDEDGDLQLAYYDPGVGTGGRFDRLTGGVFGWGLDKNIAEAYKFLALNYEEDDKIYLFGFSRGAYTVRSLAGLIYASGLVLRDKIREIPTAIALYRDTKIKPKSPEAKAFRANHAREVDVTFLGCWDTVGALGVPDLIPYLPIDRAFRRLFRKKYSFHNEELNRRVINARHAVAIDERRRTFKVTKMVQTEENGGQLKERWFPGTHGCAGGGEEVNRGLSDCTLDWMIDEAVAAGLTLSKATADFTSKPDPTIEFDNRIGLFGGIGAHDRTITGGHEVLHPSVLERWSKKDLNYRPKTLTGNAAIKNHLEEFASANR